MLSPIPVRWSAYFELEFAEFGPAREGLVDRPEELNPVQKRGYYSQWKANTTLQFSKIYNSKSHIFIPKIWNTVQITFTLLDYDIIPLSFWVFPSWWKLSVPSLNKAEFLRKKMEFVRKIPWLYHHTHHIYFLLATKYM